MQEKSEQVPANRCQVPVLQLPVEEAHAIGWGESVAPLRCEHVVAFTLKLDATRLALHEARESPAVLSEAFAGHVPVIRAALDLPREREGHVTTIELGQKLTRVTAASAQRRPLVVVMHAGYRELRRQGRGHRTRRTR